MTSKWQGEPKRWRVRGKAPDGLIVTLGRYDTENQAQAAFDTFAREGVYRNLKVEPLAPPAPPPTPDG